MSCDKETEYILLIVNVWGLMIPKIYKETLGYNVQMSFLIP